jgi:hypothetical protein
MTSMTRRASDPLADMINFRRPGLIVGSNRFQGGYVRRIAGLTLLLAGAAGCALAQVATPEIDPSSGITAIALLSGGLVVLWGYRRPR